MFVAKSHKLALLPANVWLKYELTKVELLLLASYQQPATRNQKPATSNQKPATSNQQPATGNNLIYPVLRC